jgi:hypothetical protein
MKKRGHTAVLVGSPYAQSKLVPQDEIQTHFISKYDVSVEAVLKHEGLRECFHAHLKRTYNENPFLFLMETEKYLKLPSNNLRHVCAGEIMERFVVTNAPCEINISHEVKTAATTKYYETTFEEASSRTLFSDMRHHVLSELKVDSLLGFLNSEIFKETIVQYLSLDENFLDKIGSLRSTEYERRESIVDEPTTPLIETLSKSDSVKNSPEINVHPADTETPIRSSSGLGTLFGGLMRYFQRGSKQLS